MDALSPSLLPLTAITHNPNGALPEDLNLGNFAQNSQPGGGGLFALLLSQVSVTEPLATPTTPGDEQFLGQLTAQLDDESLPLSGNVLPLPLTTFAVAAQLQHDRVTQPDALLSDTTQPQDTVPLAVAIPVTTPARVEQVMLSDVASARKQAAPTPAPVITAPIETLDNDNAALLQLRHPTSSEPMTRPLPVEVAELQHFEAAPRTPVAATVTPSVAAIASAPVAPLAQANPTTTPQPSFLLEQPVADPNWGDELGQRLVWMTENGIGRAQLRMNPPELGPVEVRVAVANDDARVSFHVQHGATREALESALPRLREMFASQGLNLSDANVSEQSTDQQQQARDTGHDQSNGRQGEGAGHHELGEALAESAPAQALNIVAEGTIDAYA